MYWDVSMGWCAVAVVVVIVVGGEGDGEGGGGVVHSNRGDKKRRECVIG
jgi:hypothetical protein